MVEQSTRRLLKDKKFERASGGHEWWRCTPDEAVEIVLQACGGAGRTSASRWRQVGAIEPKLTGIRYSNYRWVVARLDRQNAVQQRQPGSGAPNLEQAEAHLERHLLPDGMVAAVLWDREEGTRLRYDLVPDPT